MEYRISLTSLKLLSYIIKSKNSLTRYQVKEIILVCVSYGVILVCVSDGVMKIKSVK